MNSPESWEIYALKCLVPVVKFIEQVAEVPSKTVTDLTGKIQWILREVDIQSDKA